MSPKPVRNRLQEYVIKESVVLTVIVINAVVLFLDAFPTINAATIGALHWVDYGCMVFFVLEASIKISRAGFGGYWSSGWNKLDFMIVVGSLPLLASPFVDASLQNFSILLLLRLGRLLRFSRVMRFVPNAAAIWLGVVRSLKASVAVLLVLFVLNLILAMGANLLFGNEPGLQEHFGNPLLAFYSLFKVFTVEGWYEIPDQVARSGGSAGLIFMIRMYFMLSVLVGGLLGLSMANAVFVDEMTADNNDRLEQMVENLHGELQQFREEMRRTQTRL